MTPIDVLTALFIAFLVVCVLWLVLGTLFLAALLLLPWSCLKERPRAPGDKASVNPPD